jgi:hypothetical protein
MVQTLGGALAVSRLASIEDPQLILLQPPKS